jgi:hypothetical protein
MIDHFQSPINAPGNPISNVTLRVDAALGRHPDEMKSVYRER